jgi:exonuclease III
VILTLGVFFSNGDKSLAKGEGVCIQTFNTYGPWYAPGLDQRTSLLKEYFKSNPCDVVMLQEVWVDEHLDEIKEIFNSQGYQVFHFDHISLTGKMYGLVTAIKGVIEGQGFFEYEENYDGFMDFIREKLQVGKGVGILRVKLDSLDQELFVVNTHMHHSSVEIREKQTKQLLSNLTQLNKDKLPLVLGGDFNFDLASKEAISIQQNYNLVSASKNCSYCSDNDYSWTFKDKLIDHIFISKSSNAVVSDNETTPKIWKNHYLSDHFGQRVFIKL